MSTTLLAVKGSEHPPKIFTRSHILIVGGWCAGDGRYDRFGLRRRLSDSGYGGSQQEKTIGTGECEVYSGLCTLEVRTMSITFVWNSVHTF